MPNSSLDDTLAAIGYVKVIATLKETAAASAPLPQVEQSLAGHFTTSDPAQVESLALFASHSASRKVKRSASPEARRVRVYPHLGLAVGYIDAGGLASLRADPKVEKVEKAPELSLIKPFASQPARAARGTSWGIKRLNVERLWAAGYKGKGVLVGHLDTGVDGTHPVLSGAIGKFAEFDMLGDQVPGAKPTDSGKHGTHTAGTIVGRSISTTVFGVAPEALLASAMVIEGGQVLDRILAGMDWVIEAGARILSMSLGLRGYTPAFQSVIDALRAANVLPIIASGNEGANTSRSPGNYTNVLSVGAIDVRDQVPDFSSSQQFNRPTNPLCPTLVAPGVDILSCVPGGKYMTMNGTSMATPHVAGLAALLLQAQPSANATDLENAIVSSCALPNGVPKARADHGMPDAVRAFQLLTGNQLPQVAAAAPRRTRAPKQGPGRRTKVSRGGQVGKQAGRGKVAASNGKRRKKSRG